MAGIIAALDTTDVARAQAWAAQVRPACGLVKLGLEFLLANGMEGVRAIGDVPVFLDLKLHDIPNTVAGAVRGVLPARPRMITVHAAGGPAMIAAARREAEQAGAERPMILAVTVLTSIDAATLAAIGVPDAPETQVLRLARMAMDAGADGLVCSAHEVATLRAALDDEAVLVVPGIRPAGFPQGDQKRTMTPREAATAGADWLVIGRPITSAANPGEAAAAIAADLAAE
jgi:orotidine-5'-phosphate decarboxylase